MGSKSGDWYKKLRENNPEEYKKLMGDNYSRRVKQLNEDSTKFAQMKFSKQRAGALSRGLSWNLSNTFVHKIIKETKNCQLSGRDLVLEVNHVNGPSLDRIDSRYGYSTKNIQVTSQLINKAKGEMTNEEFIQMCVDVATHNGRL